MEIFQNALKEIILFPSILDKGYSKLTETLVGLQILTSLPNLPITFVKNSWLCSAFFPGVLATISCSTF
jgi:hypothetical protein